jgi:Kef-type K+ transport system membrane component KefB
LSHDQVLDLFVLIFGGAALLAILVMALRQPILLAYILLGFVIGPYGLAWVPNPELISNLSEVGILFLLFLLGLDMRPGHLFKLLKNTASVGLVSSLLLFGAGYLSGQLFSLSPTESLVTGAAMMFSSTIIGIKLLPTTALHHKHIGEVVVSLLLIQDILAIIVLIALADGADSSLKFLALKLLLLPLLTLVAVLTVNQVLKPILMRFDRIREFVFLLTIGWCMTLAALAHAAGLSWEIGAFIAGVSLATLPVARLIADQLKPLRDFFLILFFFSVGASINPAYMGSMGLLSVLLAVIAILAKPFIYRGLFRKVHERGPLGTEAGWRLGQMSEFSLLIASLALAQGLIGAPVAFAIQMATLLTFVASTSIVVRRFPNPIALSPSLRRD